MFHNESLIENIAAAYLCPGGDSAKSPCFLAEANADKSAAVTSRMTDRPRGRPPPQFLYEHGAKRKKRESAKERGRGHSGR